LNGLPTNQLVPRVLKECSKLAEELKHYNRKYFKEFKLIYHVILK